MPRQFHKKVVNTMTVAGIIAFLGLILMTPKGVVAGKEGEGVDNVNKLKYADPVKDIHLYLCAFHIAKNNPEFEIEAHHYCSMRNLNIRGGEIHQCIIYDSKEAP